MEIVLPVPAKAFLQVSPNMALLFAPFTWTRLFYPIPPFLFMQSLSPKDIVGS